MNFFIVMKTVRIVYEECEFDEIMTFYIKFNQRTLFEKTLQVSTDCE